VGATCVSDVEAMTAQEDIFGPGGGASDTTMPRVLDELAGRLRADGLPGRRLSRHGQLPAVTVAGRDLTRPATDAGASGAGGATGRHSARRRQRQGTGGGDLQAGLRVSPVNRLVHQHW